MPSDRPQVKYRVDPEAKKAFERYVDHLPGTDGGRYGVHLERAMREYIEQDRMARMNQMLDRIADNLGVEKVGKTNPAVADGRYAAPRGKNPGDVRRRTEVIVDALLDHAEAGNLPTDDHGTFVTRKIVTDTVEQVADIQSKKSQKEYLKRVVGKSMFRRHPNRTEAWVVEP